MITERYRRDYDGEFVITEVKIKDNVAKQTREWIANSVTNQHISSRAAVIGSDIDRKFFEWRRLYRHKGGLLAKKKLQTYGQADMHREMPFDFLVTPDHDTAQEIANLEPATTSVVFASASICLKFPGQFHLVPYLPTIDPLAQAIYLAAFDGHHEIFLLGYSKAMPWGNRSWDSDIAQVFEAYSNTQFWAVGRGDVPDSWQNSANVDIMPYKKFITYCDV